MTRHGEAQFHHRDETVAAGDDASIGTELAQERDRFREIGRPMIFEGSGDQDGLPRRMARTWFLRCERDFSCLERDRIGQIGLPINGG